MKKNPIFFDNRIIKGYIFIGMSGSGKTTMGRKLAEEINYQHTDSDWLIEKKKNLPLQTIVDSYQDKRDFIELEKSVLKEIVLNRTVLSTGGSACYSGQTLKNLSGQIIFLKISWSALRKRMGSFDGRGVILFHDQFEEEFNARQNLYRDIADIEIDCDGKSINEVHEEIKRKIYEGKRKIYERSIEEISQNIYERSIKPLKEEELLLAKISRNQLRAEPRLSTKGQFITKFE